MKWRYKNAALPAFLFIMLSVLTACTLPSMIPPNPANPVRRVAVLPMYNATNDVDGPAMVRGLIAEKVGKWHYQTQPIGETDQILRDQMGITLGSQLELTDAKTLAKTLGVDGVVYSYLLNFETVTTGVYNVKKVRAGLKLVDAKTGGTVWARGLGVKSELTSEGAAGKGLSALQAAREAREGMEPFKSVQGLGEVPGVSEWRLISHQEGEDMGKAAMFSLGEKLAGKIMGTHLKHESTTLLNMIFADFPPGPGAAMAAAYVLPAIPAFEMKGMTVPAYMDFGDRDFSSDLVMTTLFRKDNKEFVVRGRLAKRGENFRSDLDMTEAMKAESKEDREAAARLLKWTFIEREKEMKSYTLYPEVKKYLEVTLTPSEMERPKVVKERLGEETVDGKRCVKYRVTITEKGGPAHEGLIWEARDFANFIIRSEFEEKDYRHVMELKNLRLVSPPPSLFQIPRDYVRAGSFVEVFATEEGK